MIMISYQKYTLPGIARSLLHSLRETRIFVSSHSFLFGQVKLNFLRKKQIIASPSSLGLLEFRYCECPSGEQMDRDTFSVLAGIYCDN